ncbi:hypothetical protein GCM10011273_13460 [Asticcacaulis endophyticus]|uniref:Uncharacterized protein n=1 Tax=Asticcacaulis endophyticus TaxID=1395890 RepID=A0A918Q057_9CAUL|nr:hypothetical protein GCM10011273_13460 [Asticcacaulis endophyticus]
MRGQALGLDQQRAQPDQAEKDQDARDGFKHGIWRKPRTLSGKVCVVSRGKKTCRIGVSVKGLSFT